MHKKNIRLQKLRWLAEYLPVPPLVFFIRLLPHRVALAVGGVLGALALRIDKRHREITLNNLAECLPEKSPEERMEIATSVYRNLGYSAIEFIRTRSIFSRPVEETFEFKGYRKLDEALGRGRGLLVLTAHCGSWEIMAHLQPMRGYPMAVVARVLDNPYLERAVSGIRTMYGNTVINKQKGMRRILKTLGDGGTVAVLLDQNVTTREGVFVDFFGKAACTNKGLALISMKTGAPVFPVFIHRVGVDRHIIEVGDEIPLIDTGDRDEDIRANTQAYTKAIEDNIRDHPQEWFWMHRRWKTRPANETHA